MKIKFVIFSILSLFILFNACSDDPSSIGSDLLKEGEIQISSFDSNIDSVNQYSNSFVLQKPLGSSNFLILGKSINQNMESDILMHFNIYLNDEIKSLFNGIKLISTDIELYPGYKFGDTTSSFDFEAYEIKKLWDGNKLTFDSLSLISYDNINVIKNKIITDTLYTLSIDTSLVRNWFQAFIDTNFAKNYGLIIKPSVSTNHFVGFNSFNIQINSPILRTVIQKPDGGIDTLTFSIFSDTHLINGSLPQLSNDKFVIQSGLMINSMIHFDLSKIPMDAIINKAEMTITSDSLESKLTSTFSSVINAYYINDSTLKKYDNTFYISLRRYDNQYKGDISRILNQMIHNKNNQGIFLTIGSELNGLDFLSFYNQNSDVEKKPNLKITYTYRK
ncbi:MAG: hypothetical protein STSR0008_04910 [Ignavibacterium sp.]